MSLLSEVTEIAKTIKLQVETGVFTSAPPDEYIVLTPIADGFDLLADDAPNFETQEVRISLFTKGNYMKLKDILTRAFIKSEMTVTDRRYIAHEDDTGYHHYAIDVAKTYEWRNG